MTYVTSVEGTFHPAPTALMNGETFTVSGWDITVTKDRYTAKPPSSMRWNLEDALRELDLAMAPVLTVLAAASGMKLEQRVRAANYASDQPNTVVLSTAFAYAEAGGVIALASGPELSARLIQQVQWVGSDSIYRDLLELLTEASAARNPRPAAYKLTERLEVKFGGIPAAKEALGLTGAPFDAIRAHQNRYHGDRHATYDVGDEPTAMAASERDKVIFAARLLVARYEATVLGRTAETADASRSGGPDATG